MCNERTETWLRSLSSRLAAPTGRFREKVLEEIAMRLKKREGSKRMREEGSGGSGARARVLSVAPYASRCSTAAQQRTGSMRCRAECTVGAIRYAWRGAAA